MRERCKISAEYWSVKGAAGPNDSVKAIGSTTASKSKGENWFGLYKELYTMKSVLGYDPTRISSANHSLRFLQFNSINVSV